MTLLETVTSFWNLFFFPLLHIFEFGAVYDVLMFTIVVLAGFTVVYRILEVFLPW